MSVDRSESDALPSSAENPSTEPTHDDADRMDALRGLLLRADRAQMQRLQKEVASSQLTPERLSTAIDQTVRDNPQKLVDVISPIMGPAIRQSIRQTIQTMFQSVNQVVEQSLSWKGLQWRMESWRTGIPFAQVVLMRTLIYRVEEVYLIHRQNGLLLSHVADPTIGQVDAGVISGMLTAIEDFVRDAFRPGQKAVMDTVQFHDEARRRSTTCWIECGKKALLVAVIQGNPPELVRQRMRETLERIHGEFAVDLDVFQGDNEPFTPVTGYLSKTATPLAATEEYLEECLINEFRPAARKNPAIRAAVIGLPTLGLLALLAWLAFIGWRHYRTGQLTTMLSPPPTVKLDFDRGVLTAVGEAHHDWIVTASERAVDSPLVKRWDTTQLVDLDAAWLRYLERLRNEPGVEITRAERVGEQYQLRGLCDPLARKPDELLGDIVAERGDLQKSVHAQWTPFISLDPALIRLRLERTLQPPETVQLEFAGGKLTLSGTADRSWLLHVREMAATIPGVTSVDLSGTQLPVDPMDRFIQEVRRQPGIILTQIERQDSGITTVHGLRDELAADTMQLLTDAGIDPQRIVFHWKPYVSSDEPIVYQRAVERLDPPKSVVLGLRDGKLTARGRASRDWIARLRDYGTMAAGVTAVDMAELIEIESMELRPIIRRCEGVVIYFERGDAKLTERERHKLMELADDLQRLVELAEAVEKEPRVDINGFVSVDEAEGRERVTLSESRAKATWSALVEQGVPGNIFVTRGGATQFATSKDGAQLEPVQHRRVQLQVRLGNWEP